MTKKKRPTEKQLQTPTFVENKAPHPGLVAVSEKINTTLPIQTHDTSTIEELIFNPDLGYYYTPSGLIACPECYELGIKKVFHKVGLLNAHRKKYHDHSNPNTIARHQSGEVNDVKDMNVRKALTLPVEFWTQLQFLKKHGYGKTEDEIIKKGISALYYKGESNEQGGDNMANPMGMNPNSVLGQLKDAETTKAILEAWRDKGHVPGDELDKMLEFSQKQYRIKMMNNLMKGGDDSGMSIEKIMMLKMLQEDKGGSSPQIEMLKQQNMMLAKQLEDNKFNALQQQIAELKNGSGANNPFEALAMMERIRGDRDRELKEMEMKFNEERLRNSDAKFDMLKNEFGRQLENISTKNDFSSTFRNKIEEMALKKLDFNKLMAEPEETTASKIKDFIHTTIEQIREPILTPLGQAMAQKMMTPPKSQNVQMPPPMPISRNIPDLEDMPMEMPQMSGMNNNNQGGMPMPRRNIQQGLQRTSPKPEFHVPDNKGEVFNIDNDEVNEDEFTREEIEMANFN